ncbi:MAG: Crp/Fnr family transcriptional regulator [Nitrospirales bacterium]|nr:Crp/Fnr family transcriptional regulator [Nitrospirales bacterium]
MKPVLPSAIPDCTTCHNRDDSDICDLIPPGKESQGILKRRAIYQPGQFVFYEGHVPLGLYVLCQGKVKLTRLTRKGQQRVVGIVDAGHLLEKHVLQEQAVHQVTCEVLEPSQVCLLDRPGFLNMLKGNGELAVKLVQVLSKEMAKVTLATDQFAFSPAKERLAGLLLELQERFGEAVPGGTRLALNLKREDIAQMAAVTVETAVRLLHDLQANGLIAMQGRDITILKSERLRKIAGVSV